MDRLKELYEVFLNRTDDGTLVATSMKVTLTMVSALTMSVVLAFMVDNSYRDFQSARITTFAAALNPEPIRQVIDTDRPTDSDGYRYLLQQLRGMRQVNDDVYYAYMLRQDLSSIQYLADAEGPGNPGYSPPGKQYLSASPQLRSVFINDQIL